MDMSETGSNLAEGMESDLFKEAGGAKQQWPVMAISLILEGQNCANRRRDGDTMYYILWFADEESSAERKEGLQN
jgi:hypothetical protein